MCPDRAKIGREPETPSCRGKCERSRRCRIASFHFSDSTRYRQARVGVISLEPGRTRLTFRAGGDVHGSLCDLRGIRLVPVR